MKGLETYKIKCIHFRKKKIFSCAYEIAMNSKSGPQNMLLFSYVSRIQEMFYGVFIKIRVQASGTLKFTLPLFVWFGMTKVIILYPPRQGWGNLQTQQQALFAMMKPRTKQLVCILWKHSLLWEYLSMHALQSP